MKDRQGVMRGKCNECNECNEYVKPSEGARCDYCDHVPTQHVQIIKLGSCKKCDECDEYVSDEEFSYTDCQYCGCKPSDHKGAEKLRKKPPTPSAPPSSVSAGATPMGVGKVGQLTCKYPGCTKPCFSEHGKIHEFCGRTHAQKFKEVAPMPIVNTPSKIPFPSVPASLGSPPPYIPPMTSAKSNIMCYECQSKPPNPGYNICQDCYVHRTS